MSCELETALKGSGRGLFKALFSDFPGGFEGNQSQRASVKIASHRIGI